MKIGLQRAPALLQSARGATGLTYGNGMLTTFRHLPPGSLPPSDPNLVSPVKHPRLAGLLANVTNSTVTSHPRAYDTGHHKLPTG